MRGGNYLALMAFMSIIGERGMGEKKEPPMYLYADDYWLILQKKSNLSSRDRRLVKRRYFEWLKTEVLK